MIEMAILKETPRKQTPEYRGKQAKTGNSLGLRFDRALFRSHPEFSGEVRAHVIAPGRMLVVAEPEAKPDRREADPVMEAFLSFLAADMVRSPHLIKPPDGALMERVDSLVGHLSVDPNEDLGDTSLL